METPVTETPTAVQPTTVPETPATPVTPSTPGGILTLGTPPPSPFASVATPAPAAAPSPSAPPQKEPAVRFQIKHTIEGHTKGVCSVKFSPNGKYLASCSPDLSIRIWKMDGTLEKVLEDATNGHTKGISDLAWSFDSNFLSTCSDDKTIKVWNVATGEVKTLLGHASLVICVSAHPKQHLLVSGSDDTKMIIWNAEQGRVAKIVPAHSESVSAVTYNKEGNLIASSSYDGTCKLWNADTYELMKVLVNTPSTPVSCVKFAPNSKILLVSTMDNLHRLVSDAGQLVRVYRGHKNTEYCLFSCMFVKAAAKLIISGSEDGAIVAWNLQSKSVVQKIENAHSGIVFALDAHPTQNCIVTAGTDKLIKIWELA